MTKSSPKRYSPTRARTRLRRATRQQSLLRPRKNHPRKPLLLRGHEQWHKRRYQHRHEHAPTKDIEMDFQITISGFVAIYIFMLAAFAGWVIIGHVPAILHTPLMSGSNFVHGIVVVGGIYALLNASTAQEQVIGFIAVLLGAGNAAGGYAVTDRMLAMFQVSGHQPAAAKSRARARHLKKR